MLAPILFTNVALGIVFAEGLLRGSRTDIGHTNSINTEARAKSSLEQFLVDVGPRIEALLQEGADAKESWAGIIRHGAGTIDPRQAASSLLSNSKFTEAFPQGPPEELRSVLHALAKRSNGKSKTRRAKASLAQHVSKADPGSIPDTEATYIGDQAEDEEPLDVSEDAVKKAVKQCNVMILNARKRLDEKCSECMGDCNKTSKNIIQTRLELARLEQEATVLLEEATRCTSHKERATDELADITAANLTISTDYFAGLEADMKEIHRIKDELAVTTFMLNITRCPASALPQGLLQKNMTGGINIQACSTNGSMELSFLDPRLESGKKRLSLHARELLAFSIFRGQSTYAADGEKLDDGDGDDDEGDERGLEYLDQAQGIGMIQTGSQGQKHQQKPCPIGHVCSGGALPCHQLKKDCGVLHDTFAGIWGEVKDEYEILISAMAQKKAEFEKKKAWHNNEADILSLEISNLDAKFLQIKEEEISLKTQKNLKQDVEREWVEEHDGKCSGDKGTCKSELESIAGTYVCGPMAVRDELLKNVNETAGDCELGDWVAGPCSVDCDDSLVGGFKTLERQRLQPNTTIYGLTCPDEDLTMTQRCGQFKCAVNCELDDWSDWSECTRECGGGATTRSRSVKVHPANGGQSCKPLTEAQECNADTCDKDCGLLDWTDWTPCSSACGGGEQARFREEDTAKPAEGLNGKCPDYYDKKRYKNQTCNIAPCVGDEVCMPAGKDGQESKGMDVVILLDTSGSLTVTGFKILRKLAIDIVERMNATAYGNEAVRVGLVQFGNGKTDDGTTVSPAILKQGFSGDIEATKTAIEGMEFQRGFTNMAQGLLEANRLLERTARNGAARTVVMITDGFPSSKFQTAQAAQRVRRTANLVVVHVKKKSKAPRYCAHEVVRSLRGQLHQYSREVYTQGGHANLCIPCCGQGVS
jgi:uncharacterized protein YegL